MDERTRRDWAWLREQLHTMRQRPVVPGGGLLGVGADEGSTSWDGGETSWDDGATRWDVQVVDEAHYAAVLEANHAAVLEAEAAVLDAEAAVLEAEAAALAAAFRVLRTEAYGSEAWSVIEGEVVERAKYECAGCRIENAEAAPRLAVSARPIYYSMNDDGTFDFMCKHLRYLLVALCAECCEAHDARFNGMGLPGKGPYIR